MLQGKRSPLSEFHDSPDPPQEISGTVENLDPANRRIPPPVEILTCYSEVWKISWQHTEKVSFLECSQDASSQRPPKHRTFL
uniref:Uncharacterized protein n=1 Tax=Pyxicephalus adspersus TaxID=30357 RepID=A0AAV3ANZ5_PYXAD|nr:TPA: hypothetical protein GDO54_011145 [Pyxicephalus adspersus]